MGAVLHWQTYFICVIIGWRLAIAAQLSENSKTWYKLSGINSTIGVQSWANNVKVWVPKLPAH